ncbi:uncharacterized protein BBOV_IV000880 [Babesia bovis T2Bo]|uniref:RRM domain-containing protein n=1 Tax=Babesia bovis TaxID=5865 RepID=A7AV60_BABBO|nr:uncharacterized protein BBOV_IV000880 [Babesia bovis T2Bo]EDO05686.1 hypothetical protein BBOV_IV000880 [Babesia bovis T2Bo]|eukprot:XP_001609254.1 hypothetical protein [Babesia bovis T2Bo]
MEANDVNDNVEVDIAPDDDDITLDKPDDAMQVETSLEVGDSLPITGDSIESGSDVPMDVTDTMESAAADDVDAHKPSPPNVAVTDGTDKPADTTIPDKDVVSDEDRKHLDELMGVLVTFAEKLADSIAEDEDEEGAVEEDEVPFERIADHITHSRVVQLLNLPPEIEVNAICAIIGGIDSIVVRCYSLNPSEINIVFVSPAIADEARKRLDSMKVHNRTIQAILCIDEEHISERVPMRLHPGPVIPPPIILPPLPPVKMPHPMRHLPMIPPIYPIPPFPPKGAPPLPIRPPVRIPEHKDRRMPPVPRMVGPPVEPHGKGLFGRNIHKRMGKSLMELLSAIPQVSHWSPDQPMEDQQRNYDVLNKDYGIINRYLLVGGLPGGVTDGINEAKNWLSTYTSKKVEIEICRMEGYAKDLGLASDTFLHLTMHRRTDCIDIRSLLTVKCPEVICRYSGPRKAYASLWIGNVADTLSYCHDELELKDLLSRIGDLRTFKYSTDKSCVFVTYGNSDNANKARNRILGASFSGVNALGLNVDFTVDVPGSRYGQKYKAAPVDARGSGDNDLSQKLGERLLSALQKRSDGDVVIRQLLDGRDGDAMNILAKGSSRYGSSRGYESRYSDNYRHGRGGHSSPSRTPWDRSHKRGRMSPEYDRDNKYRKPGPMHGKFSPNGRDDDRRSRIQSPISPIPKEPDESSVPPVEPARPKQPRSVVCDLLKRGKPICKVSAQYVRGDISHKIPEMLDVNQRANPERLANYLLKAPELSMWQLGAECSDDSVKYDSLCDYLISKNRIALVQEGPYDIYIVPPSENATLTQYIPNSQFMYAFVLPKG